MAGADGRPTEAQRASAHACGGVADDRYATISIGLVALPGGTDLDDTSAKNLADEALYAAKAAGQDRVCVATLEGTFAEALSKWGDG